MIIDEKVVEFCIRSSNSRNSSGNCWEGGNEITVGACFCGDIVSLTDNIGRFFPIERKVLIFMTGAAAVGVTAYEVRG
jgi:hypothetical protein